MNFPLRIGSVIALVSSLAACGTEGGVGAEGRGPTDQDALGEDSMLAFLNGPEATFELLVDVVRIQARAATNITTHVRGADGTLGTRDDDLLDDVEELDAIPYVGPATLEAIRAYVRTHTQSVDLTVEDVELSSEHAAEMVVLANQATAQLLDDDVGLDARAANAIVAARPIADIHALAAVSYVGTTALTRLRDYVISHPQTVPPPGDVRIMRLSASKGYGVDPYWEEHNDGVFMTWESENATACTAALLTVQGVVLAERGPDRGLNTSDSAYFFGELGNHGGEEIDVRMTCTNAAGASAAATVRAGNGPSVVSVDARIAAGTDAGTQESGDGAQVAWSSEMAVGCAVEIVSLTGDSLLVREGLPASGETFVRVWPAGGGVEVDVKVVCTDSNGAPGELTVRATTDAPAPVGVDCTVLDGGTFDTVAFTADEECTAVKFLNAARFSEMGAMPDGGRRIAYDCAPSGTCGFRASAWTALSQFSGFAGVGTTSLSGLKTASAGWTQNGLPYDTIANVWTNRVALTDKPIHVDSAHVVRMLPNQGTTTVYACVEVRDTASAPNFMTACLAYGHDSAPIINAGAFLEPLVGTQVSLRGTLRVSAASTGGYRITLSPQGPGAANPAVP